VEAHQITDRSEKNKEYYKHEQIEGGLQDIHDIKNLRVWRFGE
jgi:hypothetical protein